MTAKTRLIWRAGQQLKRDEVVLVDRVFSEILDFLEYRAMDGREDGGFGVHRNCKRW